MATGIQAVERFSEELEIIPAAVERAARALKETNPPMWAKGKQGGGKNAAHVNPQHVVNLLLALMATDTRTEAPEAARLYRDLTLQRKHEETSERYGAQTRTSRETFLVDGQGSLLTGNQPWKNSPVPKDANLGTALEAIVREACKPHDRADPWTFAHWFGGFTLWRNEKRAEIKILLSNDRAEIFEFGVSTPPMLPGLSKGTLIEPRRGRLDMPVTASADTFNFMADLVLDSERIRGLEKGNAGTVGTDPASVLSQPGASPANIFQCMLKDSDLEEREQGAASSDSHGSPSSSGPLDHQSKDEPSWKTITSA